MKKLAIPLVALLFVGAVLVLRPGRNVQERSATRGAVAESENVPVPPREPVPPSEAGQALHDSTLLGMIHGAKVADRKGDAATRKAMLAGLRKEPASARRLLNVEISVAAHRPWDALKRPGTGYVGASSGSE